MDPVKTLLVAVLLGLSLALGSLTPVAAHQGDPCAEDDPGHSAYAQHHIVDHAKKGELGHGGHKPGEHRGYAGLCP